MKYKERERKRERAGGGRDGERREMKWRRVGRRGGGEVDERWGQLLVKHCDEM